MNGLKTEISKWLQDYLEQSGLSCFVVGVSGGVDSAVVSTLCAQTGLETLVLNMPINSKPVNTSLSELHCQELTEKYVNVSSLKIDATDAFDSFLTGVTDHLGTSKLAEANSKARMRMMILYYAAANNKGIVVGTGNKVEDFGVGFYTKYGDGGVDVSPIADLTKTQVRRLAKELEVNPRIIAAPPTDGLWEDDRTDEEQIGASYEELEWAMETEKAPEDMTGREKEVLEVYRHFNKRNSHKMNPIPIFRLNV
tara:strand:- start:2420 stop:3178 length:759 start_codon:yes stop_codon:yes gene_type:complete